MSAQIECTAPRLLPAGEVPATVGCAVCRAQAKAPPRYAAELLAAASHVEANAEAIADALGFCASHGREIQDTAAAAQSFGSVMLLAVRRSIPLVEAAPAAWQDHLRNTLFAARSACPACSFRERRLAGLIARRAAAWRQEASGTSPRGGLCLPHFFALLGLSELSDLAPWLAREIEGLALVQESQARNARWIATAARSIAGLPPAPPGDAPASSCPACGAARAARERWRFLLRESLRTDAAPHLLLPACERHLWDCVQADDRALAHYATCTVLARTLDHLRGAAQKLDDAERKLELAKQSVWYRRKSPAYILGQRRRLVTGLPRCPACERVTLAAERALFELFERLGARRQRDHAESSVGLCMKHFAAARLLAPSGAVRASLVSTQSARLRSLELALSEAPAKHWREAVALFSTEAC